MWKCVYIKKVDVRSCLIYWSISGRYVYIHIYLCRRFVCIYMWKCVYIKKVEVRSCLTYWSISGRYAIYIYVEDLCVYMCRNVYISRR